MAKKIPSVARSTATVGWPRPLLWLAELKALPRLGLALAVAGGCFAATSPALLPGGRYLACWDGFAGTMLLLTWLAIATADAARIRRVATSEDPGSSLTFLGVLLATAACLYAVTLLLKDSKQLNGWLQVDDLLLAGGAVAAAWLLLHTLFTLRYAHLYFSEDYSTVPPDLLGGLEFAGAEPTTYWDFAYFAFVLGMSAQTADVSLTSLRMRKLALLHGLLSFAFNTALVALVINVVSSIL